ncbi:putative penicillin-binding protein PbpX [Pelotomaculum sp. FP]|uniref:serine hydrolase n=1 Tax=Pelotomaculum sp. FP TaxID=261474 RepID=UPI001064A55B|nr:serine hydrolase [Pelotomaculum sp. FP]TEB16499.1 putative penicillin-binding protein PbpX [Pelotomaculum sp. FP]
MKYYNNSWFKMAILLFLAQFMLITTITPMFGEKPDIVPHNPVSGEVALSPHTNILGGDLDAEILTAMEQDQIVGLSAVFVKDGKVVWSKGYGFSDLERERPAGADTIYRIASLSKTVVATALMQLWEQGRFGLDDDISDYLGFTVRNPNFPDDKITFRMLLTHTSSILDNGGKGGYNVAINSANTPLLQDILSPGGSFNDSATWAAYRPGAGFTYSNFGSGIIASLVEKISGERFNDYCNDHIFRPLGMEASYDLAGIAQLDRVAVLYTPGSEGGFVPACDYIADGEVPKTQENTLPLGNAYKGTAGGIRTSAADLAKFMIAHMNGGVYENVRILNPVTVDLMQQMQWFGSGLEGFYKQKGLNFHITDSLAGRRLTGHAGQSYGLISDMYFDRDENSGVILIINGGHYRYTESGFTSIEETIINKLYNQLAGPAKNGARRISVNIDYLTVNGRKVVYPVTADIKTSDTFIPAISLTDALETTIEQDQTTGAVTLMYAGKTVRVSAGKAEFLVNGQTVYQEIIPYDKGGYLMLPLGRIAELLGVEMVYQ